MTTVGLLPHVFHVRAYQHFAELDKVAMRFILHLNRPPRILPATHHLVAHANEIGAADDGKRDVGIHRRVHFGHRLIVDWKLVDVDTIVGQLGRDFRLELLQFRFGNGVGFGNDWNYVYFGVQLLHAHQVNGLQAEKRIQVHISCS